MLVPQEEFDKYKIRKVELPEDYPKRLKAFSKDLASRMEPLKAQADVRHRSDRLFDYEKYKDLLNEPPIMSPWLGNALWIFKFNDAIEALNVIIHDLISLRDYPELTGRPHSIRLLVLQRSFFSEFYRIKELFTTYTKEVYRTGAISNDDMKLIRETFYQDYEGMILWRNRMQHTDIEPGSTEFIDLRQLEALERNHRVLQDTETGQTESGAQQLRTMCDSHLNLFSETGNHLAKALSIFVQGFAQALDENHTTAA